MRLKVSNVCQLYDKTYPVTQTVNGVTFTNNGDGSVTVNGTASNTAKVDGEFLRVNPGDRILMFSGYNIGGLTTAFVYCSQWDENKHWIADLGYPSLSGRISTCGKNCRYIRYTYRVDKGNTATNAVIKLQIFDLTKMYGAGNEPTTVEQFRQDFPNEMYEYSPVCWKRFRRLKYVTETKNLFDINSAVKVSGVSSFSKNGNQITVSHIADYSYISANILLDTSLVGKTVTFCAYAKTSDKNTALLRIQWLAPNGLASRSLIKSNNVSGQAYQKVSLTGIIPAQPDDEHNMLCLSFYSNGPNVPLPSKLYTVVYTDIQLELGDTASPYQPYGYLPLNRGKYIANKEPVQLLDKTKYRVTKTLEGITFTNNGDGTWTVVGTAPDDPINHSYVSYTILNFNKEFTQKYFIPGHKIVVGGGKVNYDAFVQWILGWTGGYLASNSSANYPYTITEYPENFGVNYIELRVNKGKTVNFTFKPQFFDLTEMYGAGNEPTTVAQFRADYPNELYDYNPYNAITFR